MAKQKLLRMAFTRRDIGLIYTGLSELRKHYAEAARKDDSERLNSALCMADIDEVQNRIVRAIAGVGGMDALAMVAPDRVAEKHAARVQTLPQVAETFAQPSPLTASERKRTRKRSKAGAK